MREPGRPRPGAPAPATPRLTSRGRRGHAHSQPATWVGVVFFPPFGAFASCKQRRPSDSLQCCPLTLCSLSLLWREGAGPGREGGASECCLGFALRNILKVTRTERYEGFLCAGLLTFSSPTAPWLCAAAHRGVAAVSSALQMCTRVSQDSGLKGVRPAPPAPSPPVSRADSCNQEQGASWFVAPGVRRKCCHLQQRGGADRWVDTSREGLEPEHPGVLRVPSTW